MGRQGDIENYSFYIVEKSKEYIESPNHNKRKSNGKKIRYSRLKTDSGAKTTSPNPLECRTIRKKKKRRDRITEQLR